MDFLAMRMAAALATVGFRLDREGGPVEHAECGDGVLSEEYVARTESGYYVAGTRVSLDSIVYAFLEGQTAEAIAQAFPVLTLEQVYGALTYYLAHREPVDAYLSAQRKDFEAKRAAALAADPMFYQKLAARRRTQIAS
jgi:uncharacterized protein (DUF433 family)